MTTKPFWAYEDDLFKMRDKLESECEQATTLKQALDTGANSIRLQEDGQETYIGYLDEDGSYRLANDYIDLDLDVNFLQLDRDDDGYTIAIFEKVIENDD